MIKTIAELKAFSEKDEDRIMDIKGNVLTIENDPGRARMSTLWPASSTWEYRGDNKWELISCYAGDFSVKFVLPEDCWNVLTPDDEKHLKVNNDDN